VAVSSEIDPRRIPLSSSPAPRPAAPTTQERCQKQVARLAELTGIAFTFGYIGNCSGIPGTPAWRDDRSWFVFAPHPGRVGTHEDSFGGVRTEDLAELLPLISGAIALARIQARKF
jgi:hypothetical protein